MVKHCVICVSLWDSLNPLQVASLCLYVCVMNIFRLNIFVILLFISHHLKPEYWIHCSPIEVICIIIHDVVIFFVWIIICSMIFVCFCVSFEYYIPRRIPFSIKKRLIPMRVKSSKSFFVCLSNAAYEKPGAV